MAPLRLQKEEILAWKVQGFPVPYDKKWKVSKSEIWYKTSGTKLRKT